MSAFGGKADVTPPSDARRFLRGLLAKLLIFQTVFLRFWPLQFGEDVGLEIHFSRLVPAVEVEFLRMWDSRQTAFTLMFGHQVRTPHEMRLVATLTQHTIAAIALVQRDMARPSAVKTQKPMDALFSQQLRRLSAALIGDR